MRKRDHGVFVNTASLLVCGLLAGIVVAAAAFPVVAVSGLAAKASVDAFDNLPSTLTELPPPQISYVYASDAKTLLAMFYDENRRDVHLTDIAPVMQQAIVAAEDQRFYQHHGVDMKGVARAAVANGNSSGQVSQGASTLTQQYVRQALTYSARTNEEIVAATEQTPARKLREMKYALAIEKKYNKQQILERYLNISSFGHGAYGVYAASEVYFGKDPKDLTLGEASLLAGLVKAPSAYDPADPDKLTLALQRRDYVLRQMVTLKYITQQQADEAKAAKLTIVGKRSPEGCASMPSQDTGAGFFCDFLYRWWLEQPDFGADAFARENKLKSGGYKIISSLDVGTQTALKKNVENALATGSPYAVMTAAVEPGTGKVLGLATNRNFSNDQSHNGSNTNPYKKGQVGNYPNTTAPLLTGGGDIVGYQAGSTFKMFTMVAALEKGYNLDYTINTTSPYKSKYPVLSGDACGGMYCPVNATPSWMNGPRNMWTGFGRSVNTYFVPLEERVGAENAVDVAKRLGIQFRARSNDPKNAADYELANSPGYANGWGAFTLGVSATTPLDLANAYATLAADGTYCAPTPISEIRDMDDKKLDLAKPQCHEVVKPDVARAAVDAARCPLGDQSAFGRCDGATGQEVRGIVKRPVAGKTGTTDGDKTATLVAMTKQIAIAGILGDPDWPLTDRLRPALGDPHKYVNKAVEYALRDAMADKPAVNFTAPSKDMAFGKRTSVPAVACKSVADAKSAIRRVGFDVTVDPDPVASDCPAGSVAKTEPAGDTSRGSLVTIYVSKGGGNQDSNQGQGGGAGTVRDPNQGTGPPRNQNPRCKLFPALCGTF
ncbi:PASTA domain-containing protein [Planosporangium thailandense]|uniref:PASTA domain-containing protein n=1 Tax=Planosporangium thailandense TaxID=765197 RepID=A0ABX0XTN2_9ACTN|nr:transglycosylase domain-containing protein [Planosporangium thailandense]NJC69153.1 PASTA domain-containing protein [Planosporangium thailandense]